MWVYDGEQWREDDDSDVIVTTNNRPKAATPSPYEIQEFVPELQVVEIVPLPRTDYVPPFPLP
jgi:hypothetical protein